MRNVIDYRVNRSIFIGFLKIYGNRLDRFVVMRQMSNIFPSFFSNILYRKNDNFLRNENNITRNNGN